MPRKKTTVQQLKSSLREAATENNVALQQELQQILIALQQSWPQAFHTLTKLLQQAISHVTKHYIAEIFGSAKDPRVLKPLMRAAVAPENENYTAVYFWACSKYDCTAHVNFFVQFLFKSQDPGEAAIACVNVIEEMQGPFDKGIINRNIIKLLKRNRSKISAELQEQDEMFTIQAAYALLDKYFDQVDANWKSEHSHFDYANRLINERRPS